MWISPTHHRLKALLAEQGVESVLVAYLYVAFA